MPPLGRHSNPVLNRQRQKCDGSKFGQRYHHRRNQYDRRHTNRAMLNQLEGASDDRVITLREQHARFEHWPDVSGDIGHNGQ